MRAKYSPEYIDQLLSGSEYTQLVDLSAVFSSSSRFDRKASDYGLSEVAFVYVETLCWFAQSIRSGTWTYFEATPEARQKLMHAALNAHAPEGFAEAYRRGAENWQSEQEIAAVDEWIEANDSAANQWLWRFARQHRDELLDPDTD
jgi:hypothetical protein